MIVSILIYVALFRYFCFSKAKNLDSLREFLNDDLSEVDDRNGENQVKSFHPHLTIDENGDFEENNVVDLLEARKQGLLYKEADNLSYYNIKSSRRLSSGFNTLGSDFDAFEDNIKHRKQNRACTEDCDTICKNLSKNGVKSFIGVDRVFYSNEELGT